MILTTERGYWTVIIHDFNEGFYWADVSSEYPKPIMMLWMQTNTKKTNNELIHITMQEKVKDANILKMPPFSIFEKIFVLKNEDIACPGAMVVILTR